MLPSQWMVNKVSFPGWSPLAGSMKRKKEGRAWCSGLPEALEKERGVQQVNNLICSGWMADERKVELGGDS